MKMTRVPASRRFRLDLPSMHVERLIHDGRGAPCEDRLPRADGFAVEIQLANVGPHRRVAAGETRHVGPLAAGAATIHDMTTGHVALYHTPVDRMCFTILRQALRAFAAEAGRPEFNGLRAAGPLQDSTLHGLAQALIPALDGASPPSRLFVEQVGLAVLAHLVQAHGGLHFPPHRKGGLSARQEAQARDYLAAHLAGDVSMDDLAGACGLSRSYFGKAFKVTFGKSPYRWLTEYRVARACDALRTGMPIAQVALACGFTDQSHLTRVFAAIMQETPGSWRRTHAAPGPAPAGQEVRTARPCASFPETCPPIAKRSA